MRKPRLVVGVAASAMLLAGGAVATAAGAQESPGQPGWSGFAFPDLADLFGGSSGDWAPRSTDPIDLTDKSDLSGGEVPLAAGAAAGRAGDDAAAGSDGVAAGGASGGGAAKDGAAKDGAAGGDDAGDRAPAAPTRDLAPRADRDDQGPAGQGRDDQGRDGQGRDDRDRDAAPAREPALANRQAGGGVMSSARQRVTDASVSSSPNAPVQQQVLVLINQSRRKGGCDALSLDRRLIEAANDHAADMARRRYFAHASPNGDGAGERVSEAGYSWKRYGENIARGADSAYEVVNGWMDSPSHRENILDCRLEQMGIGLALDGDDTPYWVQDFATPKG